MTNPKPFRPEPTEGTNRSTYLWPRSKVPEKQRIYDYLHDNGWRYDSESTLWFTPEAWPVEGHGRLEYEPDLMQFCVQPPSAIIEGVPHRFPALLQVEFTTIPSPNVLAVVCPECKQITPYDQADPELAELGVGGKVELHTWPPGEARTCPGSGRVVNLEGVVLPPSIFGRERAMVKALTTRIHAAMKKEYEYSPVRERSRGSDFEVRMDDGRIAKITVELDRIEEA